MKTGDLDISSASITDMTGREIKQMNLATVNQVDLSDLADGTYMLVIQTAEGTSTTRLIKTK